jgi:hypothetical protein
MKYWLDTEFIARPFTIDLISIGVVAENGREFYAESNETDWSKASPWTLENVRPQLKGEGMSREYISYALRNSPTATSIRCSGAISRPMIGSRSSGFSAASWSCRSTFPTSASTSSNGRSSLAIRSFRTRKKAATTLSPTPAGRKKLGGSLRAAIPPAPTVAPPNARTPAKPARERPPLPLHRRQTCRDGCR